MPATQDLPQENIKPAGIPTGKRKAETLCAQRFCPAQIGVENNGNIQSGFTVDAKACAVV